MTLSSVPVISAHNMSEEKNPFVPPVPSSPPPNREREIENFAREATEKEVIALGTSKDKKAAPAEAKSLFREKKEQDIKVKQALETPIKPRSKGIGSSCSPPNQVQPEISQKKEDPFQQEEKIPPPRKPKNTNPYVAEPQEAYPDEPIPPPPAEKRQGKIKKDLVLNKKKPIGLIFTTVILSIVAIIVGLAPFLLKPGQDLLNTWNWEAFMAKKEITFLAALKNFLLIAPAGIFGYVTLKEVGSLLTLRKWKPKVVFALTLLTIMAVACFFSNQASFLREADISAASLPINLKYKFFLAILLLCALIIKLWTKRKGLLTGIAYYILLLLSVGAYGMSMYQETKDITSILRNKKAANHASISTTQAPAKRTKNPENAVESDKQELEEKELPILIEDEKEIDEKVEPLPEELSKAIQYNSESKEISFDSNALPFDLTDEHLRKLAPILDSIVSLNLSYSSITDEGMWTVARMNNLRRLNLSETKITNQGIEAILALPHLKVLKLAGTKITDAGLEDLLSFKQVSEIDLRGTEVSKKGLVLISKELPTTTLIRSPAK